MSRTAHTFLIWQAAKLIQPQRYLTLMIELAYANRQASLPP